MILLQRLLHPGIDVVLKHLGGGGRFIIRGRSHVQGAVPEVQEIDPAVFLLPARLIDAARHGIGAVGDRPADDPGGEFRIGGIGHLEAEIHGTDRGMVAHVPDVLRVHPAVGEDIKRKMSEERTLLIESAILYEAGLDRLCDRIIVVDAPEDVRIARVIERDYHGEATGDNINKVRARMRTQGVKTKGERAKGQVLLVNNDGRRTIEQLATEIEEQIALKQDSSNR